jgi:hypothetical protein
MRTSRVLVVSVLSLIAPLCLQSAAFADPTEDPLSTDVYVMSGLSEVPLDPQAQLDAEAPEVPDATFQAAKLQVAKDTLPDIAAQLADGTGASTVSVEDSCPDGVCPAPARPPASFALVVNGQEQQHKFWCVPASAAIIVGSMGSQGTVTTQATFARAMATAGSDTSATGGTAYANISGPLNRRQTRNKYMLKTDDTDVLSLFNDSVVDLYRYRAHVIYTVNVSMTRYYPSKWTGNHAIVNYAYNTANGGSVKVWDPENSTRFGATRSFYGSHTLSAADAWRAVSTNTGGPHIIW